MAFTPAILVVLPLLVIAFLESPYDTTASCGTYYTEHGDYFPYSRYPVCKQLMVAIREPKFSHKVSNHRSIAARHRNAAAIAQALGYRSAVGIPKMLPGRPAEIPSLPLALPAPIFICRSPFPFHMSSRGGLQVPLPIF